MRLIFLIAILLVLGLGLLQPNRSNAQRRPYGVFQGRIFDVDGNVVRGASVTIESASYTRAVKANGNGHFGIELPVGVYTITVNRSGFAAYRLTNVNISAGGDVHFRFQLERRNRQSANRPTRSFTGSDA
jgi:hypothetical protein